MVEFDEIFSHIQAAWGGTLVWVERSIVIYVKGLLLKFIVFTMCTGLQCSLMWNIHY